MFKKMKISKNESPNGNIFEEQDQLNIFLKALQRYDGMIMEEIKGEIPLITHFPQKSTMGVANE